MYEHINSWQLSRNTFEQQLEVNLRELRKDFFSYPKHWQDYIHFIELISPKRVIDVGCGCGGLFSLTAKHFPTLEYYGFDYSQNAINIAKQTWNGSFTCKSYTELQQEFFKPDDVLVANALADVLPNGNECISFLLKLRVKNILFLRVRITDKPNYFEEYGAYDIITYAYYHNKQELFSTIQQHNYNIITKNYSENILDILVTKNEY